MLKRVWSRSKRYLFAGGLIALVMMMFGSPVHAISDPDSISLGDAYVFRSVIEDDDWLVFIRYDVSYGSTPSEDASDTFQMALYDNAGTGPPGTMTEVPTRELEYYQHNIRSIYFTPAQAAAVTWEADYSVRVMGQISYFPVLTEGTNMKTQVLSPSNYKEKVDLGGVMLTQAEILEADWGITLIADGLLNTTGATYFLEAVPGLNIMVPEIFSVAVEDMTINYTAWDTSYADSMSGHTGTRLRSAIQGLAGTFMISEDWMAIWMVTMAAMTLSGIVFAATKDSGMAMMVGVPVAAGAAYLGVGASMFTILMSMLIVAAILFGIHFILARFA